MSLLFRTFIPSSRRQRQPPLGGGSSGLATPSSNGDGKNFASAAVEPASTVGSMYRNPYEPKEEAIYPGEGRRLANGSVDSEEGHELEQGKRLMLRSSSDSVDNVADDALTAQQCTHSTTTPKGLPAQPHPPSARSRLLRTLIRPSISSKAVSTKRLAPRWAARGMS